MQAKLEIKSPEKRGCEKSGVEMGSMKVFL